MEQLRSRCDRVGWSVLGYLLLVFLTLVVSQEVTDSLPLLSRPSLAVWNELLSTLLSVLCLVIPYGFFLRPSVTRQPLPFSRPAPGIIRPALLLGMGVATLGNLLSSLLKTCLGQAGWEIAPMEPAFTSNPLLNLVVLLGVTLSAALSEELVFRGLLLQSLRPWGDGFAILLSAAVFSLSHSSLLQSFPAFLSGLVFGYVTVVSRSLWPSILAHLCYNGLAVFINQGAQALGGGAGAFFSGLWTAALLAGGGWALLRLARLRRSLPSLSGGHLRLAGWEKAGAVFTSPVLIMSLLCLVINLAGSVTRWAP